MKPVIMGTCDVWKGSRALVGVFTNRKKLERQIRKMLKDKSIEIDENSPMSVPLSRWTIRQMHDFINYISLEEVEFNEEA